MPWALPLAAALAACLAAHPTDPLNPKLTSPNTPLQTSLSLPPPRFDFPDLCARPLGAADYIAIVGRFHTLCVSGVPAFTAASRAEAYRFVTLIDVCYEHRTRVLLAADALPFELFENIVTQARGGGRRRRGRGVSLMGLGVGSRALPLPAIFLGRSPPALGHCPPPPLSSAAV